MLASFVMALPANDTHHWTEAHEALTRLARQRAALDAEEGRWLLLALRSAVHVHLGYGSFCQYIERLFGYKARTTQEKLRVADALEGLPRLAGLLSSGELSWCAVRELTRVVVPETEQAWLEAARGKIQRELEVLVANASPGDTPDETRPTERPRVLRFEVAPDTFATFREATQRLARAAGGRLDDDALLLAMARHVLGGPQDAGRSSYQISLDICSACGRGVQRAGSDRIPVDAAIVAMATCDAQHLGEILPGVATLPANANADRSSCDDTDESTNGRSIASQCSNHAHVGATSQPDNDNRAFAAAPPDNANPSRTKAHPRPRARQSIPPALHRAVLARDRHCRVPGCSHATFLDVHHIQPSAEGGSNDPANLLGVCSPHHRATHRGELLIERQRDGALTFRHADGSPYGHATAPRDIDAHTKVFAALRHLGFREGDVKAVLADLRRDPALAGTSIEHLLREALCRIKPIAR